MGRAGAAERQQRSGLLRPVWRHAQLDRPAFWRDGRGVDARQWIAQPKLCLCRPGADHSAQCWRRRRRNCAKPKNCRRRRRAPTNGRAPTWARAARASTSRPAHKACRAMGARSACTARASACSTSSMCRAATSAPSRPWRRPSGPAAANGPAQLAPVRPAPGTVTGLRGPSASSPDSSSRAREAPASVVSPTSLRLTPPSSGIPGPLLSPAPILSGARRGHAIL